MVNIISGGISTPSQALDGVDTSYFEQSWDPFATTYDKYGTGPLTGILAPFKSIYKSAAEIAKAAYKGAAFGGMTDNKGFNMQEIRAVTVRTQSAAADVYDWNQTINAIGWGALFGSINAKYNTGINSTLSPQDAAYTVDNVIMLITHLYSLTPPLYDEYQFGVGQTTYAVQPIRFRFLSGIYVAQLPNPILLPLNTNYFFMANFRRTGTEGTAFMGAAFVRSAYAVLQ